MGLVPARSRKGVDTPLTPARTESLDLVKKVLNTEVLCALDSGYGCDSRL